MPTAATLPPTRIFEDHDAIPTKPVKKKPDKSHRRIPSVGDVLRGRRLKENDRPKRQVQPVQKPLGERHVNSPPQPKLVPLKSEDGRSKIHKKADSSISLKSLMGYKDETREIGGVSSDEKKENHKPKKSKSSTNLSSLLRKKSKKSLKEQTADNGENQENVTTPTSTGSAPTPIWVQFATQPLEDQDGRLYYPQRRTGNIDAEIALYAPQDCSELRPSQQRNVHDFHVSVIPQPPPQRPLLEHKSSRSSIFKEDLDEGQQPALVRPKSRDQNASRPSSSRQAASRSPLESQHPPSSQPSEVNQKRGSRVLAAVEMLNLSSGTQNVSPLKKQESQEQPLSPIELDSAFERVLESLNVPLNMRDTMRSLKPEVKAGLIKGERIGSGSSVSSITSDPNNVRPSARSPTKEGLSSLPTDSEDRKDNKRSRSRPRSRVFTLTRREDSSPTKKQKSEESTRSRSKTRPKSVDMSTSRPGSSRSMQSSSSLTSLASPDSAASPSDFIHYLREVQKPELVEVGKMHKLRILLRNESVAWTDAFVKKGGMDEMVQLLYRIVKVEWREEHEDNLLHETLLCLKALCTTSLALQRLTDIRDRLFPTLLGMLFDEERKGPSEFSTRNIVVSLLFAHLSEASHSAVESLADRAQIILQFLRDPSPEEEKRPLGFIQEMHVSRPYRVWCKEVVNVTKEVFWIFLHHLNVIPIIDVPAVGDESSPEMTFSQGHFPRPRPPHPAAPYVGGVEWEATQYLATHLDLLNGLVASLPTQTQRNELREELKQSGWEKIMGGTMRTCKEKFYGGVHEGLKGWVAAAKADGWAAEDVRSGPPREASPRKSPVKKGGKIEEAPKLMLDVGVGAAVEGETELDRAWL
jgi:hypothetical protein